MARLGSTPIISSVRYISYSSPKPITSVRVTKTPPITMSGALAPPHPLLEVVGGGHDLLLPAFTTLHRPYSPFPLLSNNCHVETIFASIYRSAPQVRYKRECRHRFTRLGLRRQLAFAAGLSRPHSISAYLIEYRKLSMPGLTGGSQDSYVRHMLVKARSKGWRVVVFNSRGCGDSPVTTPQFYSASFLGDMREVVALIAGRYPIANLYAVGWSLGANILVNYMGRAYYMAIHIATEFSDYEVICVEEHFAYGDFRKGFNAVYDKALTKSVHALLFEDIGGEYNIPLTANANSVREFDGALTRVSFGFKSVDEYYSNSSSSDSIKHVLKPLLCIQADNDPIAPARGIPRDDIKENPNCLLIVTPKGGHLGWIAGDGAPLPGQIPS